MGPLMSDVLALHMFVFTFIKKFFTEIKIQISCNAILVRYSAVTVHMWCGKHEDVNPGQTNPLKTDIILNKPVSRINTV